MIPSIPQANSQAYPKQIPPRLGCRRSPGRFYCGQQSPDLNPIENLWWDLKKSVAARKSKNITELEANTHEEWAKDSSETLPEAGVWLYMSFAAGHKRVFY